MTNSNGGDIITTTENLFSLSNPYLLDTRDKEMIYRPDITRGLECYVDAYFAGGWKDGNHESP